MTPTMEFKTLDDAKECLLEWQHRLYLGDWMFGIALVDPDEMKNEEVSGENTFEFISKSSLIRILRPAHYGASRVIRYCAEQILIHELLHCKYNFLQREPSSYETAYVDTMEHVLLEQMSRSLLMAKYNLEQDWFMNANM